MCCPGSISAPHHGHTANWCGDPTPNTGRRPLRSASTTSADCSVRLGVVLRPTHSPSRKGVSPHFAVSPNRICSQAQISVAARWNCCSVSSRRVYRISTATPFSPSRPPAFFCNRRTAMV